MPPRPFRTDNRFGKRFIKSDELWRYTGDLGVKLPINGGNRFLEFLEREGILFPVRRIDFGVELVRRLVMEDEPAETILGPAEQNDSLVRAALSLHQELASPTWPLSQVYGETPHLLDEIRPKHRRFIRTTFSKESFVPWENNNAQNVYADDLYYPTYYHYWHAFFLTTYLRSAATIYYPVDDEAVTKELRHGNIDAPHSAGRLQVNINIEARSELNEMRRFQRDFDAVGYFKAYANNALQAQARHADPHGRLARRHSQAYRKREKQIAIDALAKFNLVPADLIEFLKAQCRWWGGAERRGPPNLADEWKRQIRATEDMLRAATGAKYSEITDAVGRVTGHHEPTLDVIFPNWIKEQRRLATRSLTPWVNEVLAGAPAPFALAAGELDQFCDWLEAKDLYQFYWHYRRLVDGGWQDGPVERAASTAEAAGLANLVEMIANAALVG